jgi:hypothetical protein
MKAKPGNTIVRIVVLFACASLCVAGCATGGTGLEATPESLSKSIWVGDHLIITTSSGSKKEIYVTEVSDTGISSKDEFIPYSEIQSVRMATTQSEDSIGTMIMVAIVVAVVAYAFVSSAVDDMRIGGSQ